MNLGPLNDQEYFAWVQRRIKENQIELEKLRRHERVLYHISIFFQIVMIMSLLVMAYFLWKSVSH